jgi:hypothetical protein
MYKKIISGFITIILISLTTYFILQKELEISFMLGIGTLIKTFNFLENL